MAGQINVLINVFYVREQKERERVLFIGLIPPCAVAFRVIGTQFSVLYTSMYSPAKAAMKESSVLRLWFCASLASACTRSARLASGRTN